MVKNEIRPLTGIRGFAAIWVVLFHYKTDILMLVPALSIFNPIIDRGAFGVDIFFVLSGFVISNVYQVENHNLTLNKYRNFLINRIARIYPNYLFCFTLLFFIIFSDRIIGNHMSGIKHVTNAMDYPLSGIIWHLSMVQAWPFIPAKWDNWNTPAWSVSAEWFAYLFIFPFSVWLSSKKRFIKNSILVIFGLLSLFIYFSPSLFISKNGIHFIMQVSCEYLAGCCIYLYFLKNKSTVVKYSLFLDFIFLIFIAFVWFSSILPFSYYLILFCVPIIICFLTQEKSVFSKILATPFFCYLGRISYALYLVHAIAQRMLHVVAPTGKFTSSPAIERIVVTMGYLIFPIIIAAGIYHLVEEPSRIALRKFFRPKSEVEAAG